MRLLASYLVRALSASLTVVLVGCAARPTDAVLVPSAPSGAPGQAVTLIAATNRTPSENGNGFTSVWANNATFERYTFSVPLQRDGTSISYVGSGSKAHTQYSVLRREKIEADHFVEAITSAASFDGTAAVFVHGYNNSFQESLFRTAQMAADVTSGGSPIVFSWPSAASVTGYVADRDAAMYSRSELSAVLSALGKAPKVQRIILLGHSMGGFLSMEAVRQLRLNGDARTTDKLRVILASPDIDVDVFRSQLADIGKLRTPIILLVSASDRALIVSSILAGQRQRVGKVDVDNPAVKAAAKAQQLRIVDISALKSIDGLGHDRFATFARFGGGLVRDELRDGTSYGQVGAFVFDAAGRTVRAPFRFVNDVIQLPPKK